MTYPTLAICKLVWSDYIKVSGVAENAQVLTPHQPMETTGYEPL